MASEGWSFDQVRQLEELRPSAYLEEASSPPELHRGVQYCVEKHSCVHCHRFVDNEDAKKGRCDSPLGLRLLIPAWRLVPQILCAQKWVKILQ